MKKRIHLWLHNFRRESRWGSLLFASAFMVNAYSVMAQAPILVDSTLRFRGEGAVLTLPISGGPQNWSAPLDFRQGQIHWRLDISRPADMVLGVQPCLRSPTGKESCGSLRTVSRDSLYAFSETPSGWKGQSELEGDRPAIFMLKIYDCYGVPVDEKTTTWSGAPFIALYYPLGLRVTVAMTPPGVAFTGWGTLPVLNRGHRKKYPVQQNQTSFFQYSYSYGLGQSANIRGQILFVRGTP